MNKSESIKEIAAALSKAQGEFKNVTKDAKNPFFKSNYAPLDAIIEMIRVPMLKNGLSFLHVPSAENSTLECVIMHSSGEWISGIYPLNPTKNDPQGLGSCVTYAKRYSLSAMLGIATEDDDGEAATNHKQEYHKQGKAPQEEKKPEKQEETIPQGNFDNALKAINSAKTEKELQDIVKRFGGRTWKGTELSDLLEHAKTKSNSLKDDFSSFNPDKK